MNSVASIIAIASALTVVNIHLDAHSNSPISTVVASSYQVQETSMSLPAEDLHDPFTLTIKSASSAASLTGTIKLNGKVLRSLDANTTEINLSEHLSQGKHKIEVEGRYSPDSSAVEVSLRSRSSETVQEMGGSGQLNQVIHLSIN